MSDAFRPAHAVLVRSPEGFSAAVVAGVLAGRARVPALDMAAAVHRSWGLVAESLPAAEAEDLAAALGAAGQDCVAVPTSLLEQVPPVVSATKIRFSDGGFELLEGRERPSPERMPWPRLAALCAAGLEVKMTTTVAEGAGPAAMAERAVRLGLTLVTGLPLMKRRAEAKRTVESRDRRLLLDILFLDPPRRVRVDAGDFDYSVLGARMGYGAELNFRSLLEALALRAPPALLGRGSRALLARRPAGESLYESLDLLEREERWLLSLAALRATPGG